MKTGKYIVKCSGAGYRSWEYLQEASSPDDARKTAESTSARVLKVTPYIPRIHGTWNQATATFDSPG